MLVASAIALVSVALLGCGVSTAGERADGVAPRGRATTTTPPTSTVDRSVIGGLDAVPVDDRDCLDAAGVDDDGLDWYVLLVLSRYDEDDRAITELDDAFRCYRRGTDDAERVADGFADAFDLVYDTELDADEARCLLDRVAEFPSPGTTLVDPIGSDRYQRLLGELATCADDSDADAAREVLVGPDEVGESAELDALLDRCESDDRACDLLYLWSGPGTEYEELARDCFDRRPGTAEFCTGGLTLDGDGWVDPEAPGLDRLGDECRADDGLACDLLYQLVDLDHPLADLAATCNGRFPDGADDACFDKS